MRRSAIDGLIDLVATVAMIGCACMLAVGAQHSPHAVNTLSEAAAHVR